MLGHVLTSRNRPEILSGHQNEERRRVDGDPCRWALDFGVPYSSTVLGTCYLKGTVTKIKVYSYFFSAGSLRSPGRCGDLFTALPSTCCGGP